MLARGVITVGGRSEARPYSNLERLEPMYHRLSAILLTVPMLSVACGDATIDPYGPEGEDLELAFDEPLSELAVEQAPQANSPLAQAIAAHPSFPQLSAYAWTRAGEMLDSYAVLDDALVDEEYQRLSLCQQHETPLACYDELSGIDVSFALSPAARAAGQAIESEFGLAGLTLGQRVTLFHAAQEVYEASGGAGGSPALIPNVFGNGTVCDASCKDTMLDSLAYSQAGFVAAASKSGGAGNTLSRVLVEVAKSVAEMVVEEYIKCLFDPDCHPWPFTDPDENECNDDDDCLPNGFCHLGPLGVGVNECRDKREVGDACSRDAKCESDCCRFNLFDLGSTCRPANQCN